MRTRLFYLEIFFFFICLYSQAQDTSDLPSEERPKIGLVLSGGGAKGMAHVGAIKVLEEVGIVPDYITGTSMGSLVGALYAIGYTADEMDAILNGISWDQLLSDKVTLREITIEEKPYYGRYLIELPMNGLRVGLPRGALNGQKLSELFSKLTLSVHDIDEFKKFPIPFAAMAVDLPSGTNVLLDRGSLPQAMRASMAIPTIFTPVSRDDTLLLVDGGLARNFPVQEVLDMGADVVIGINVAGGFSNVDDIRTLADVLIESSFLYSNLNTLEDKKNVSVLIEPDLSGYSTGSFVDANSIINRGYIAALKQKEQLKKLADSVYGLSYKPGFPEKLAVQDSFYINHIAVNGNDKVPSSYIRGKLNLKAGRFMLVDEIEKNIELLYGTRFFNKITYEIRNYHERIPNVIPEGLQNVDQLIINVEESPDAFFRPALHYDTENGAGFILSYVHRNLFLPSSRLTLEADFAENPRVFFNYYKYLGRQQRFAAILGVDYILNDIPAGFGVTSNRASSIYRSSMLNPYLRLQTSQFQNWMVGINAGWETARLKPTVTSTLPLTDSLTVDLENIKRFFYNSFQFGVYAQLNSLDEPFFPNRGWWVEANIEQTLGVKMSTSYYNPGEAEELLDLVFNFIENTARAKLQIKHFMPLSRRWNLQSEVLAIVTQNDLLSPYDSYEIGGFNPLLKRSAAFWGARLYEISATNALTWRESARFEMIPDLFAEAIVNVLVPDINEFTDSPDVEHTILGYGLGIKYRSILGPIQFSLAHRHNTDRFYGFFSLGFNVSNL